MYAICIFLGALLMCISAAICAVTFFQNKKAAKVFLFSIFFLIIVSVFKNGINIKDFLIHLLNYPIAIIGWLMIIILIYGVFFHKDGENKDDAE